MEMKVYVIIVTYNGKKWYERCFDSLRQSTIPVTVLAIDNASSDDTVSFIKTNYPEVKLILSEKNSGFGQANNIGIKQALIEGADYVFLLNQDAWIEPNTLKTLIEIQQSNPQYGILSPIHRTADRNQIEPLLLQRLAAHATTDIRFVEDAYFKRLNGVYDTKYVNAAAWLLPRKTLETVGGFDPIFFHYGEDDNYINRVIYHGLKIGICPKAVIVHDCNPVRELYDNREQKILWMIDYTNVNNTIEVSREKKGLLRKVFTSILKLRWKRASACLAQYRFLMDYEGKIKISRNTNQHTGANWL
jgi:GT2 family glycosyltransferase